MSDSPKSLEYAVVYEWSGQNYGAYSPDVPGCIATGVTLEEVRSRFRSALEAHLTLLREDGDQLPEPLSRVGVVQVDLPAQPRQVAG